MSSSHPRLSYRNYSFLRPHQNPQISINFTFLTLVNVNVAASPPGLITSMNQEQPKSSHMMDQICNHFSLDEIRSATKDFNEAFVVGRGGFGKVYKGYFKDRSTMVVAIKRLNPMSSQGAPEFMSEIEMLSKLRHCNLVSLIGYCYEGSEMALIYEYMSQGSLEDHIHKSGSPLSWLKRLKICIGAARGLDYLHTGTGIQHGIVHRDVKSSNILLDENFAAKISDFGLAKVTPTNQTHTYVSTGVKGTFGYMDPCYFYSGKLTRKSDVYAFGVVLLEVMCGRPAVDESLDDEQCGLAPWAQDRINKGKLNRIIDPRLTGQISSKCLKKFADIACRCLHNNQNQRPNMAEIVARLEAILSLQERLDSSETEGKLVNKVYLLFVGKPKASTLISARKLDGDGEPSNEIEGKVISASMPQSPSSTGTQTTRIHPVDLKAFSFLELKVATRNFRPLRSYAGSTTLHKGWIDEQYAPSKHGIGIPIVVKILNESLQVRKEWLADIKDLGRLNHPNLVKIIGYCLEDDHSRLLASEYMVNGSLGNHLLGRRYIDPLSWSVRLKIAAGFAKGLAYLNSPEVNVIYRELKSTSILLDSDYTAKLCMAWLAKGDLLDGKSNISTRVTGSNGYAAPEYIATGDLTVASNIYTFGVVFLEILTGQQFINENRPHSDQILVEFVKRNLSKKRGIQLIIDRRIDGQYSPDLAMRAVKLAMKCLSGEPKQRPTANDVVRAFEELQD